MLVVYCVPSDVSNTTVRRTADPVVAADVGNLKVTGLDELPATIFPRISDGDKFAAGTPFNDADVIFVPIAVPNPLADPKGVAVTRTEKLKLEISLVGVAATVVVNAFGPRIRPLRASMMVLWTVLSSSIKL